MTSSSEKQTSPMGKEAMNEPIKDETPDSTAAWVLRNIGKFSGISDAQRKAMDWLITHAIEKERAFASAERRIEELTTKINKRHSGCACSFNEQEEITGWCEAHKEYRVAAESAERRVQEMEEKQKQEWKPTHRHADGGLYRFVGLGAFKMYYGDEWEECILYETQQGEKCVTSPARWRERFEEIK